MTQRLCKHFNHITVGLYSFKCRSKKCSMQSEMCEVITSMAGFAFSKPKILTLDSQYEITTVSHCE